MKRLIENSSSGYKRRMTRRTASRKSASFMTSSVLTGSRETWSYEKNECFEPRDSLAMSELTYTAFMRWPFHAFISWNGLIRVCINTVSWIRQHTKVDCEFNLKA